MRRIEEFIRKLVVEKIEQKELAYILVRRFLISYVIFAFILSSVQITIDYIREKNIIRQSIKSTYDTFAPGLESAIWDYQIYLVDALTKGISSDSNICFVEVKDGEGKIISKWKVRNGQEPSKDLIYTFKLEKKMEDGKQRKLGTLTLGSNEEILINRLKKSFVQSITYMFLLLLFLLWLVWINTKKLIVRPIKNLSNQVEELTNGDYTKSIDMKDVNIKEISTLIFCFNELMKRVANTQNEIAKNNLELEKKVEDRTKELKSAKIAAESATRIKGEFLANMSHEIRTPMNAIIGFSELIQKTNINEKQLDYIIKIQTAAKSLLGIINDILDFSKIEAGKLELEHIKFEIHKLVKNIVEMTILNASAKRLKVEYEISEQIPKNLIGDSMRLGQVLINLTNNAVKFTEKGLILIKAELEKKDEKKCRIKFWVSDTGIGITEEQKLKLFTAFEQADSSITRKFGGTGLGLSISKKIVEMMNGEFWVESEYGRGSIFYFFADFEYIEEKEYQIIEGEVLQNQMNSGFIGREERLGEIEKNIHGIDIKKLGRSIKILLAEDNIMNQQIAKEHLENKGFLVKIANNGKDAIEELKYEKFDLVLMDIQMPIMGGYEATKYIRDNLNLKEIPIIALTAHAMKGAKEECIKVGMNDYISKPIDTVEMFKVITKWIDINIDFNKVEDNLQYDQKETEKYDKIIKLVEKIESINLTKALSLLSGNQKLYVDLLRQFTKRCMEMCIEISNAFEAGEIQKVERVVHTLKGISGSLAIQVIAELAQKIEIGIRKNYENQIIKKLIEEILEVGSKLEITLKEWEKDVISIENEYGTNEDNEIGDFEIEEFEISIKKLKTNLEENNCEALSGIEELKKIGKSFNKQEKEKLQKIEEIINNLNYEEALKELEIFEGIFLQKHLL